MFVDLDDAVPTPTCASGACAAGGDIAATIDNAAMFEGEYYYISANTDDLFKASFLADGTADGVPAFVDHISDNTEMYGFGDIVITDAGIVGASAARTATGGEQGSCANAGAVDPIEVLLSYVLPAGPLVELKTCDAEPIMSLGFGGEGTLFGNVSTGDPANEIYLVNLANGERRLIHDDAAPPAGYSDWADGPELCECQCDVCEGGLIEMTIRFNGGSTTLVTVDSASQGVVTLFSDDVDPGGMFTLVGTLANGRIHNEIDLFENGSHTGDFHVSCSSPIGPGSTSGNFEVVEAISRNNGLVCPLSEEQ